MSNKSEQALNVMENYIHDLDRDDAKYVLGLLVDMIMTSGERDDGEVARCQVCHCEEPATGWAEDGVCFYLCSQECADEYDRENK